MKYQFFQVIFALFFLASCMNEPAPQTKVVQPKVSDHPFVGKLESAHNKVGFLGKKAIQFDLQLMFGGKERLNGTLTLDTDSGRGRIDQQNGEQIYFLQDKVHYSPSIENGKSVRFAAYTWPYFFLLPYKLSDPGTVWTAYPSDSLNGKGYLTHKLSFESGVGDAPDDWYVLYADEQSNLTEVAAYIVTAGQSQEKAEEDPHAIEYTDYQVVDGVPIATQWQFRTWRTEAGLTDTLGNANLKNIKFVQPEKGFYTPPSGFKEI